MTTYKRLPCLLLWRSKQSFKSFSQNCLLILFVFTNNSIYIVFMHICMLIYLSVCFISIYLSIYWSIYMYLYVQSCTVCICLSIYQSIYLHVQSCTVCIGLSVYLSSIYLSIGPLFLSTYMGVSVSIICLMMVDTILYDYQNHSIHQPPLPLFHI